jgi:kinesin family protein 3/17
MGDKRRPKVEKVVVHVRVRPFTQDETNRWGKETSIDMFDVGKRVVTVKKESDRKTFVFDSLFDQNSRQNDIYSRVAAPVVTSIIQGYNGTIFAYGQTGTGKTWTMIGDPGHDTHRGIIPRSCEALFQHVQEDTDNSY